MDIGEEIERVTVEPIESPLPHETPQSPEAPEIEILPQPDVMPIENLLTAGALSGEQVLGWRPLG